MKLNVISSLVFGFVFAGSLNAMDASRKHIDNAKAHWIAEVMIFSGLTRYPISEATKQYSSYCRKYIATPLPNMLDADVIVMLRDCLNPLKTAFHEIAFNRIGVDNSLSKEEAYPNLMLVDIVSAGIQSKINEAEAALKRREAANEEFSNKDLYERTYAI